MTGDEKKEFLKERQRNYSRKSRQKKIDELGLDEVRRRESEYMRQYRRDEAVVQKEKAYRERNKEKINAHNREYQREHLEEIKARRARDGKYNEYMRKYQKEKSKQRRGLIAEVEALRAELGVPKPEYDLPALPKKDSNDPQSAKAYSKCQRERRKLKDKLLAEELDQLKAMKAKQHNET